MSARSYQGALYTRSAKAVGHTVARTGPFGLAGALRLQALDRTLIPRVGDRKDGLHERDGAEERDSNCVAPRVRCRDRTGPAADRLDFEREQERQHSGEHIQRTAMRLGVVKKRK